MPPQSTIRPRFATVDQARTRLASLVVMAAREPTTKVTAPTSATIIPTFVPATDGAMRRTR